LNIPFLPVLSVEADCEYPDPLSGQPDEKSFRQFGNDNVGLFCFDNCIEASIVIPYTRRLRKIFGKVIIEKLPAERIMVHQQARQAGIRGVSGLLLPWKRPKPPVFPGARLNAPNNTVQAGSKGDAGRQSAPH
jgi:hypothetical protein